jgi:photosystem II stability/assembly factor-like uncharacterized protein
MPSPENANTAIDVHQSSSAPSAPIRGGLAAVPYVATMKSGKPEIVNDAIARWMLDNSGVAYRSLDGGRHWQEMRMPGATSIRCLASTADAVWFISENDAAFSSTDRGQSWAELPTLTRLSTQHHMVHIAFRDKLHGAATAATGEQWITADGGQSWQRTARVIH